MKPARHTDYIYLFCVWTRLTEETNFLSVIFFLLVWHKRLMWGAAVFTAITHPRSRPKCCPPELIADLSHRNQTNNETSKKHFQLGPDQGGRVRDWRWRKGGKESVPVVIPSSWHSWYGDIRSGASVASFLRWRMVVFHWYIVIVARSLFSLMGCRGSRMRQICSGERLHAWTSYFFSW